MKNSETDQTADCARPIKLPGEVVEGYDFEPTPEEEAEFQADLAKIREAERAAWREAQTLLIDGREGA